MTSGPRRFAILPRRDERGTSIVEFSLIAPVFFMLIFGMFTGGLAYYRNSAITSAAREGARYADVHSVGTCTISSCQWLSDVATVTENNAQGQLAPASDRTICVGYVPTATGTYYSLSWTTSDSGTITSGTVPAAGTSVTVCGASVTSSSTDNQVVIVTKRTATLNAALAFNININLSATAYGRLEQ
jgi:hypothetical protein